MLNFTANIPYIHKHTNKVPTTCEIAYIFSFYPSGAKLNLLLLYEQWLLRYRLIFNIAIFEPETWTLSKVPEVAHILSCTTNIFLTTY